MKRQLFTLVLCTTVFAISEINAESLSRCSAKKTQQMELTQRLHAGKSAKTTHRKKSHKTTRVDAHQRIEQIDEWLWKNCRSYSEEMRTIEQQYM